jgi:beta-aspartyl-peptidase (threonine type)
MESIIIHGGAWNMPEKLDKPHLKGVEAACKVARDALLDGRGSLEAVTDALVLMEEDTTFDAGIGSFLNAAGDVELDAGIMDGTSGDYACCGAVSKLRNPILACKRLLEVSPNKLLVCGGMHAFAKEQGFTLIDNDELKIPREIERYEGKTLPVASYFSPSDTVGAVALDDGGHIVAANTTGGTPGKPPGRLGDSPLVGCGIYAGPYAGAAATGLGESIIKSVLTKRVYDYYCDHNDISLATSAGIRDLAHHGWGGVIALDKHGTPSACHNTTKMPYATWDEKSDKIEKKIGNPRC